jgi:hypothetical protein
MAELVTIKIENPLLPIELVKMAILYTIKAILKSVKEICGIYILWIFLHYIASHLYIHFCAPLTIAGFLMSPFLTPTPHCQALRWTIYTGANAINSMWAVLGVWLCSKLVFK